MSFTAASADFQARWEDWLGAEFGADPTTIAKALGVSSRTARYWLDGTAEPRGRTVYAAVHRFPRARAALFGEQA